MTFVFAFIVGLVHGELSLLETSLCARGAELRRGTLRSHYYYYYYYHYYCYYCMD